ncbi:MAG: SagB/ThcOx family dehydrogenase [Candidatus Omnitrophota bacterium]
MEKRFVGAGNIIVTGVVFLMIIGGVWVDGAMAAEEIKLPAPRTVGEMSLEEAIYGRKSVRDFLAAPLTMEEVGQLLWAAGGETVDGVTGATRAYPSAGGIYPLDIYLVAGKVTGLEPGIYRYDWKKHAIKMVRQGDHRKDLEAAARGQRMIGEAPVTIVVTAVFDATAGRYGDRGRRLYVPMDAGHLGQNVSLEAYSLRLGTVMVGAFSEDQVLKVMGNVAGQPVYIMPVGRPRGSGTKVE